MDSMRTMTTSLPRTSRRRAEQDILSAFKAAALSVTNLYKSAATDNAHAREAGYQDALDDLLAFLDKDGVGLDGGEGWKVRKWALERLEDAPSARHASSEEEDERTEEAETRHSSPEAQKKSNLVQTSGPDTQDGAGKAQSPAPMTPVPEPQAVQVPSSEEFSFRAATQLPTNHDRETTMDLDTTNSSSIRFTARPGRSRGSAQLRKDGRGVNFNLTGKRRNPFGDFFDISNMNFDTDRKDPDKRDNGRGGKRGRFV